jgi:hypothetical protein
MIKHNNILKKNLGFFYSITYAINKKSQFVYLFITRANIYETGGEL